MGLAFEEYRRAFDLTPYPRPALVTSEEEKMERCDRILKFLLRERGMIAAFSSTYDRKRRVIREYMNTRNPLPVPPDILADQDALFWTESVERGIVRTDDIPEIKYNIAHWQGDITRLDADAVVNAGNTSLLGCFLPGHNCIDNVIHSAAGMQLRADCARLISMQGHEEEIGDAKLTRAYNLPSKYVIHTVGPRVGRELTDEQRSQLRSSYYSILDLAAEAGCRNVAVCCVSTGVFNFPREEAAEIAAGAAVNWKLRHPENKMKIVFDTFLDADAKVYENILKMI